MTALPLTLPSSVARRIGQLTRLFASNRDGEILASARALGRKLSERGLEFHSLADVLEDGLRAPRLRTLPPIDSSAPCDSIALARQCWRRRGELNQRERVFVGDMMHARHPTEPQVKWLVALARRLRDGR
jgi:hypothetical protein